MVQSKRYIIQIILTGTSINDANDDDDNDDDAGDDDDDDDDDFETMYVLATYYIQLRLKTTYAVPSMRQRVLEVL